jgi:cell wall-associated NlpC family hydrolase
MPIARRRPAFALAAATLALAAIAALVVVLAGGHGARRTAASHARRHHAAPPAARVIVAERPDPLAAESYPDPAGAASHARASAPGAVAGGAGNAAPSLSSVEQQLREERQVDHSITSHSPASLVSAITGAFAPRNVVPLKIAQVIAGGNAIADYPYVYGGGHASFEARAYDCSGSVSYALAAAGLIGAPETSGQLESWGAPGPGRWLTVFANAGHTFMNVDGLWFDTAGRAGPYSTRWLTAKPSLAGYVIRHYPGL